MSEFRTIRYGTSDGIGTITLARPGKRNAITAEMFQELADAARAAEDGAVRALVIVADGPSFSAGIDLTTLSGLAGIQGDRFVSFVTMAQAPYRTIAAMPKPTVASIQGHALGAGFQLALACDLRIAADDARFGLLEARYGLIPDLGGMRHLVRLIGPSHAKELVWSARVIDAEEAGRLGLVNRVVPRDQLEKETEALVAEVTAHSPVTVALAKSLIDSMQSRSLDEELQAEGRAQGTAIASEDHREAVAAFVERRQPKFTGR
jgi:enoyl-CoA hydratase/carnithine racemase